MPAHTLDDGPLHVEIDGDLGGTLDVAVNGALPLAQCRERLAGGPLFELVSRHRPVAALLDLSNLTGSAAQTLDFVTTWWFQELVAVGCTRLAVVVPAAERARVPTSSVELFADRDGARRSLMNGVTMTPKLRAATWPAAAVAHGRRLSPTQPALADGPFVSVTIDVAGRRITALKEGADAQDLLSLALPALDALTPKIDLQDLEGRKTTVARVIGDLAPELILSPKQMRAIQTQLGAPALAVAVPSEKVLLAIATTRGGAGEALRIFASYVNRHFALAETSGISPLLFLVVDGEMVGAIDPLPALPKVLLFARCEAEAQLYMDLRGMEAEPRTRALVPMGDQHATVFTARAEGETETETMGFIIGEPSGMLGAGGVKGTSSIIGPSEFLTWADILAKRGPASADGLAPAVRERHKQEITLAAMCVEEVLKFIPPGQSAVPETAFATDAARRMYAKEPGRFRGARLEAVSGAYRRIADSF